MCAGSLVEGRLHAIAELGSTFFASQVKFKLINCVAEQSIRRLATYSPRWTGIDNSRFMHDVARLLDNGLQTDFLADFAAYEPNGASAALISRFVASYIFGNAESLGDYIADRFDVAVIEDAYSPTASDIEVYNHGQREHFLSFGKLTERLAARDVDVYVLGSYPDFPAGTHRCHVVRYIAAKRSLSMATTFDEAERMGFRKPLSRKAVKGPRFVEELNDRVDDDMWKRVERAKQASPVWGPTPPGDTAQQDNLPTLFARIRAMLTGSKPSGVRISNELKQSGWNNYHLDGQLAADEIERALREQQRLY
jgi:hypothetical protein